MYSLPLSINGLRFNKVWISLHYELNHGESINDLLILGLVKLLNEYEHIPDKVSKEDFQYYKSDLVWNNKFYRLIWLIPPEKDYVGVVNAYRRSK